MHQDVGDNQQHSCSRGCFSTSEEFCSSWLVALIPEVLHIGHSGRLLHQDLALTLPPSGHLLTGHPQILQPLNNGSHGRVPCLFLEWFSGQDGMFQSRIWLIVRRHCSDAGSNAEHGWLMSARRDGVTRGGKHGWGPCPWK